MRFVDADSVMEFAKNCIYYGLSKPAYVDIIRKLKTHFSPTDPWVRAPSEPLGVYRLALLNLGKTP